MAPESKPASNSEHGTAGSAVSGYITQELATAESMLLVQTAGWIRSQADTLGQDAASIHQEIRDYDLDQRAAIKGRHGISSLLSELAVDRGMAWADIARLVGVSISAVRKWRGTGSSSPEHREALARLTAFLDLLEEYAIEDPAQWMEMRLPLPSGYLISPMDLYQKGEISALLEYASQRLTAEEMLDKTYSDWRETRSRFESYDASDGAKAIRVRGSGE